MTGLRAVEDAVRRAVAKAVDDALAEKLVEIEHGVAERARRGLMRALAEIVGEAVWTEPSIDQAPRRLPPLERERSQPPLKRAAEERPAVERAPGPPRAGPRAAPTPKPMPRRPRAAPTPKPAPSPKAAEKPVVAPKVKPERARRVGAEIGPATALVLAQVAETPGKTSEELVEALAGKDMAPTLTRRVLAQLAAEGKIGERGAKRFRRYFPRHAAPGRG